MKEIVLIALLIISFLFRTSIQQTQDLTIHKIDDPEAICNDLTPAVYYFRPSRYGGPESIWHIQLMGGFWCWDKQSCSERLHNNPELMSSSKSPPNMNALDGMFSTNKSSNPLLWDANQVFVWYCSSDAWSGTQMNSELNFAFHGKKIIKSLISTLAARHGLLETNRLVFSGCSAGGVGVLNNADYVYELILQEKLKKQQNINNLHLNYSVILDSGMFFDYKPLERSVVPHFDQFRTGIETWKGVPNENCANSYKSDAFKCYLGEYSLNFIQSRMFVHQAKYDWWNVIWLMGIVQNPLIPFNLKTNQTQMQYVLGLGEYVIEKFLQQQNLKFSGKINFYVESCVDHCGTYSDFFFKSSINGKKLSKVVEEFIIDLNNSFQNKIHLNKTNQNQNYYMDSCKGFDCSAGCPKL